jgi:hypothetical protein
MNKESVEHIENKIKEAAENVAPAFNPNAWEAMEKMLDEEERKRRIVIFWWLPIVGLLGLSTLYFFLFTSDKSDKKEATLLHNNTRSLAAKEQKIISSPSITADQSTPKPTIYNSSNNTYAQGRRLKNKPNNKANQVVTVEKMPNTADTIDTIVASQQTVANSPTTVEVEAKLDTLSNTQPQKISSPPLPDSTVKTDSNNVKKELTPKHNNKFYFSLATGITRGSASFTGEGKTEFAFGLGIGYQINRKLSLQSGFYVSRKVYDADPSQYYVKPGSYLSMLQLTSVNANCLVYEVPVSVRFIISQKSKTFFYATAGLSTYFMKQENYNYNYLRNGSNYSYEKEFEGNQHPFSITGFSIGYAHKLNKRLFCRTLYANAVKRYWGG